jgi:hypothetical protein
VEELMARLQAYLHRTDPDRISWRFTLAWNPVLQRWDAYMVGFCRLTGSAQGEASHHKDLPLRAIEGVLDRVDYVEQRLDDEQAKPRA